MTNPTFVALLQTYNDPSNEKKTTKMEKILISLRPTKLTPWEESLIDATAVKLVNATSPDVNEIKSYLSQIPNLKYDDVTVQQLSAVLAPAATGPITVTAKTWYKPLYPQQKIIDKLGSLDNPINLVDQSMIAAKLSVVRRQTVKPAPSKEKMIKYISTYQKEIFSKRLKKEDVDFLLKCALKNNNTLLQSLAVWCLADVFNKISRRGIDGVHTEQAIQQFIQVESKG